MKSKKITFVCNECGFDSVKWSGICPSCGAGNSMVEFSESTKNFASKNFSKPKRIADIQFKDDIRISTKIDELDRVLGGGIVKGAFILLSGSPGVGKSTILLQISEKYSDVLYISGEESASQLKMRSVRLGVNSDGLSMLIETDIHNISENIKVMKPSLVIVDSIQTMMSSKISSIPGSIAQVKECSSVLLNIAKEMEIPILAVSHVNKEGAIAGPKVLEHMVDVVLYFEGENKNSYRIIRCIKNRFGSTNEIGVFKMQSNGLQEVKNPSAIMLEGRSLDIPGTCTASVVEGSRAFLAEIQALVSPTSFGIPRRVSNGYDYNRLCMLLAVLEKRAGFFFSNSDVYINIVGGIKIVDPSSDLPVALSLISSLKDKVIDSSIVSFGEIGLTGEIRPASHSEARISEAKRHGFKRFIIPSDSNCSEKFNTIKNVRHLIKFFIFCIILIKSVLCKEWV